MGGVFYRLHTLTFRAISYDLKIMFCHPVNATLRGHSATLPRLMSRVRVPSPAPLPNSPQTQFSCGSPVGCRFQLLPKNTTQNHPQGWHFECLWLPIGFQNATPPCHPTGEDLKTFFPQSGCRYFQAQRGFESKN